MRLPEAFAELSKGSKSGLSRVAFALYGVAVAALGLTAMFADGRQEGDPAGNHAGRGAVKTGSVSMLEKPDVAPVPVAKTFAEFLGYVKQSAAGKGIEPKLLDQIFAKMEPDDEVFGYTGAQPEHVRAPWDYVNTLVSQKRIVDGREMLEQHAAALQKMEAFFGVDRHIIIAIWGIESSYGSGQGSRNILRSLATLAYLDKRRGSFWRKQLIAALEIVANGDIEWQNMTGSWAGAMGHTQFMPTTYLAHAVDFDGDGKRNIWSSIPDALGSTAAYLKASKWASGMSWGYEVVLPSGFDYALSAPGAGRTVKDWLAQGVMASPSAILPTGDNKLNLLLPAGNRGPAFLISANFKSILRYNNSSLYALSVGHLADRLARRPAIAGAWPLDLKLLGKEGRLELQRLLSKRGLDTGGIDGILGGRSKAAIRHYQSAMNLPADGFPSADLLTHLRDQANTGEVEERDSSAADAAASAGQKIEVKVTD